MENKKRSLLEIEEELVRDGYKITASSNLSLVSILKYGKSDLESVFYLNTDEVSVVENYRSSQKTLSVSIGCDVEIENARCAESVIDLNIIPSAYLPQGNFHDREDSCQVSFDDIAINSPKESNLKYHKDEYNNKREVLPQINSNNEQFKGNNFFDCSGDLNYKISNDRKLKQDLSFNKKQLSGKISNFQTEEELCLLNSAVYEPDIFKLPVSEDHSSPLISKRAKLPFESPATVKMVNLRSQAATNSQNIGTLIESSPGEISSTFNFTRIKRNSSIKAEEKIKKQLEKPLPENKDDLFVKSAYEKMFCGLGKDKSIDLGHKDNFNISHILDLTDSKAFVKSSPLCDVTNSPVKEKPSVGALPLNNSLFFMSDHIFNSEEEASEVDEYRYVPGKNYYKLREINTKANEGYKYVVIKRKSVIGLFNHPSTFFSKNNRARDVYFDLTRMPQIHNKSGEIESILINNDKEVEQDTVVECKETVEIVRRIDLGSDLFYDDFSYKKVDKTIES